MLIPASALSHLRERVAYLVDQSVKQTGLPSLPKEVIDGMIEQLVDQYQVVEAFAKMTITELVLEIAMSEVEQAQ
jgi:hypothetical protein